MTAQELITDAEIERVHANASFGDIPKREVVDQALLKCACGYHNGATAQQIIIEHGLVKKGRVRGASALTDFGRKYLHAAFGKNIT